MILDFLYILKDITLFFSPKGILYPFRKLGWQFLWVCESLSSLMMLEFVVWSLKEEN